MDFTAINCNYRSPLHLQDIYRMWPLRFVCKQILLEPPHCPLTIKNRNRDPMLSKPKVACETIAERIKIVEKCERHYLFQKVVEICL